MVISGVTVSALTLVDLNAVSKKAWRPARPMMGGMPRMSARALSPHSVASTATLPAVSAAIQRVQRSAATARTVAELTAGRAVAACPAGLAQAAKDGGRAPA